MITLEQVVAMALSDRVVLDQLGEALRSDLALANPFYRRIVAFADDFALKYHALPAAGDWDLWLQSLDKGMIQDGTREALGRLWSTDISSFNPQFFAEQALDHLRTAATRVARARLNEVNDLQPEAFTTLADQLAQLRVGSVQGLARLNDLDTWVRPVMDDDRVPTGWPTLDRLMGGWGKELWMVFADSGVGKSMMLQNFTANAVRGGRRGLHITLELGLRPQIHRYYRQLAQAQSWEFAKDTTGVKSRLAHWFRLSQGEIYLLERPAYDFTPDELKRTVERLSRTIGEFDVVTLDYLDLMVLPKENRSRSAYEDLGRLTHEARTLCSIFDVTVLTASQAVRKPEHKDRLTIRDMGDSYNKVRGADGLLSLVQTKEEKEVHQGRAGLLKNRDGVGDWEVNLYINRELSIIQELNHPNTIELMRQLGHLPSQRQAEKKEGLTEGLTEVTQ